MRNDPHKLIEGCVVAGFAMGAQVGGFIAKMGGFEAILRVLEPFLRRF
jgi:NADH:ubiquinone oxidoreductase subunit F (NADH-binding)